MEIILEQSVQLAQLQNGTIIEVVRKRHINWAFWDKDETVLREGRLEKCRCIVHRNRGRLLKVCVIN